MIKKIAISGKANSGKDTFAHILLNNYIDNYKNLYNASIFAFADPIKNIILWMYPNTDNNILWGPSELRSTIIPNATNCSGQPLTYRQLLLDIGKFGRAINSDLWINATLDKINYTFESEHDSIAIINDLRFTNEFNKLKKEGYYLIRVIRTNNDYNIKEPINSLDISETDLDNVPNSEFNKVIYNDSTIEHLTEESNDVLKCCK